LRYYLHCYHEHPNHYFLWPAFWFLHRDLALDLVHRGFCSDFCGGVFLCSGPCADPSPGSCFGIDAPCPFPGSCCGHLGRADLCYDFYCDPSDLVGRGRRSGSCSDRSGAFA
jgi:hypothetical protein